MSEHESATVAPEDEGWIWIGQCEQGCHVRLKVPAGPDLVSVSDLTPEAARNLAADLLELANKAETHPDNVGERRH